MFEIVLARYYIFFNEKLMKFHRCQQKKTHVRKFVYMRLGFNHENTKITQKHQELCKTRTGKTFRDMGEVQ